MMPVKYIPITDPEKLWQEWQTDEFRWVVHTLHALPQSDLLTLCQHFGFPADHWQDTLAEDRLILTLVSTYPSRVLLSALNGLGRCDNSSSSCGQFS